MKRMTCGLFLAVALLAAGCSDDTTPATDGLVKVPDSGPDQAAPDAPGAEWGVPQDMGPDTPVLRPDLGTVPAHQWITVKAGIFAMGSPPTEKCRELDQVKETQHQVTLTGDFEMAKYEVTQAQFAALLWYNPSKNLKCGLNCPVERVSWHEAAAYLNALSQKAGLTPCYTCQGKAPKVTCSEAAGHERDKIYTCPGYRFPSEAEWEYAARAGTKGATYNGELTQCKDKDPVLDKTGWYGKNSGGVSHPVGKMPANPWGLYDMLGGVWEWCNDWYAKDLGSAAVTDPGGSADKYYRMIKGGSWFGDAYNLRVARRFQKQITFTCHGVGLRPVRTLPKAKPDAGL